MNVIKIKQISIIKTLRFNIHYFGIREGLIPCVIVARNVKFKNLRGKVELEDRSVGCVSIGFGESSRKTIWDNEGSILFRGKANIAAGGKVSNKGSIAFGDEFSMHVDSNIISYERIEFGKKCLISWECLFMDTDFHKIYSEGERVNSDKAIQIGEHVWVGCRSTILKGASIPDNSVIAAGSLISKKMIKSNCIYASHREIRTNIDWEY